MFSVGFLFFVWGLVQFMMNLENSGKRKEGVDHMIWGIVGMVLMSSVDALIALIDGTFHLGTFSGSPPDMAPLQGATNLFK